MTGFSSSRCGRSAWIGHPPCWSVGGHRRTMPFRLLIQSSGPWSTQLGHICLAYSPANRQTRTRAISGHSGCSKTTPFPPYMLRRMDNEWWKNMSDVFYANEKATANTPTPTLCLESYRSNGAHRSASQSEHTLRSATAEIDYRGLQRYPQKMGQD